MDHAIGVRVGDRLRDLYEVRYEPQPVVEVGATIDDLVERCTGDELHRIERFAIGPVAGLVHRNDARVLQPGGDAHFACEPPSEAAVTREQLLECDAPAEPSVVGNEDAPHAAACELAAHGVRSARNLRQLAWHEPPAIGSHASVGGRNRRADPDLRATIDRRIVARATIDRRIVARATIDRRVERSSAVDRRTECVVRR
jgi:hypothetical protein